MATRYLVRSLLTSKQSLSSSAVLPNFSPLLFRFRPLVAAASASYSRRLSTRQTASSLNDQNPNWSDGCDFKHWLVVMEKPEGDPTRDEIIDSYIKTLASIVGSEEEARRKIYSVSTRHYFSFGALVSEEVSDKFKELPHVQQVLPDSYLDVKNKDYGGEPFINGQAVPYDPKYHEEWVRNNARAKARIREINRLNDVPRSFDRPARREVRVQKSRGVGGAYGKTAYWRSGPQYETTATNLSARPWSQLWKCALSICSWTEPELSSRWCPQREDIYAHGPTRNNFAPNIIA